MHIPLLTEIVIILGLSVLIILIFQKLKLPSILGFLLTGAMTGPSGLSLVNATHEVELLAEIGVIFLLFVIGIELSLKGLAAIRKTVIGGGLLQVGGTILFTTAITYGLGLKLAEAVFMGFLLSLSSTAIVLKLLQSSGDITAPQGRISVGILIFQDIIVVPMMLLTPIMAGQADDVGMTLLIMVGKIAGVLGVIVVLARYAVPFLLAQVVKTRSTELFLMTIIVLCFSTAWLTASVGLSLALGAFFAGLVISESDYHHQATAIVLPFREIFVSFFFVSVGMLLDLRFFGTHLLSIISITAGVILLKALVVGLAVFLLRYPARIVILSALALFQVGEFAFILSSIGMEYNLLSENVYQYFLAISIVSMAITPFVIHYSTPITDWLIRAPFPQPVRDKLQSLAPGKIAETPGPMEQKLQDHLVIIGYGINGHNLSRAAKQAGISYIIVELNSDTVREAQQAGEPIVFGDASQETILQHVHVTEARVVVIAISDPTATKRIIGKVRELTPGAYIIVRTRYVKEIPESLRLGANEIIPEEFETSIEIFSRVLRKYLIPTHEIQSFVHHIRSQNYEVFRQPSDLPAPMLSLPDIEIATLPVQQGENRIVGKSIGESGLRQKFNITILAIRRQDEYITQLTPEEKILPNDILYLFGNPENIGNLSKYLLV
ncbi:MAG: cation:proton antiporter [Bacteroidia bacterium]|nr:cation:proton antiporter [Bacteroidia bacterium]